MKIAIISDIHDNLVNLEKCLNWCNKEKVEQLICCGDITNSETLQFLAAHFKGIIHLVKGNVEIYNEEEIGQYNNIKYYGKAGRVELGGQTIGICHEPYFIDKIIKQGEYDIIFYGHTHKPWSSYAKASGDKIEEKDGIKLVNPGTLSAMFQKATFAVMENDNLELKILEQL
ncbi:YfcE family phosphodiesterase [Candidatus Parcubacteria bacterium]|nr:YfcE family phosphodiesterase [Candidatus Parcubacteria bacterium]